MTQEKDAASNQIAERNQGRRYSKATFGDILLSVILPGWGLIIGAVAYFGKREKTRGGTMIIVGACVIVAGVIIGLSRSANEDREEVQRRRQQIFELQIACIMYAGDHENRFPKDLSELSDGGYVASSFVKKAQTEVELVSAGFLRTGRPVAVLLRERKADARGRRMIVYTDDTFDVPEP